MKKVLIAAALLAAGCHRPPPAPAPSGPLNVLLITIDTLRADRLNPQIMPAVEAFAAGAMRFTNARTAVPLTLPSHTTILTGAWPAATGVRVNGVTPAAPLPTVATVLHGAGYRTGAFVGAYVLDRRFGLADGFENYDDRVERDPSGAPRLEAERRGDHVVDAALAWLKADTAKPFFAWIHLYDPHAPYEAPPEYFQKAHGRAYDAEVMFADAQVARVLEWLRTSGRDSHTIVAIAGDHGEGLGDHGETTHGMLAYDSTLRVPLVIRRPGSAAGVIATPVSLVDLAGTLVQAADATVPSTMSRASLLAEGAAHEVYAETQYPKVAGWHSLAAVVDRRWKLIASAQSELYDLDADPAEAHNLAPERLPLAASLRARATTLATARSGQAQVSSEARERLRSLGYVGGGNGARDDDRAANPADEIYAWNTFERELARVSAGDARAALPGLGKLARSYKDAPVFQATYARALKDTGRLQEALDIYRRAVARWPDDASLYHDLAVAASAAGLAAEAARAEQAALALEPSNATAANGLGLIEAERGHAAEAVRAFERAVAADPTNAVYWTNLGNARRDNGESARAEQAYRAALDRDPRSADAANGMGVLLVQGGRPSEAIAWFERALVGAPDFVDARLNLGIACQQSGQIDRAVQEYRQVLAKAPPGSHAYTSATALLAQLR